MADPRAAAPAGFAHVEHVMGTVFSFDVREPPTPRLRAALADAVRWLHRMDALFSTYRADSAISRIGRGETTPDRCPPEVADVLARCAQAAAATGGYFTSRPGGRLDPSGLVKGWAVEHTARTLRAAGARNLCVNGGGDLQAYGAAAPGRPWRIGVAHPRQPGGLVAAVTAAAGRDLAVATSGTAERGAHIVDPHTGRPPRTWLSFTVVGPRIETADVYATAAFAMGEAATAWITHRRGGGPAHGAGPEPGYEAMGVRVDGTIWYSDGFPRPDEPDPQEAG